MQKGKDPATKAALYMLSAEVNPHCALVQRLSNYSCRDLSFSNYVRNATMTSLENYPLTSFAVWGVRQQVIINTGQHYGKSDSK